MNMNLGILCSGSGTNLQAILDAVDSGTLKADVKVVIANVATAKALDRAKSFGTRTAFVDHKAFPTREAFDAAVVEILRAEGVDCVVLAGFMRLVTRTLLDAFPDRVVNVHPALLPAFPGTNAQKQALDYGVRVTGCTVHFVDAGMDTGPIIAQAAVPVLDGDDESVNIALMGLLPKGARRGATQLRFQDRDLASASSREVARQVEGSTAGKGTSPSGSSNTSVTS